MVEIGNVKEVIKDYIIKQVEDVAVEVVEAVEVE